MNRRQFIGGVSALSVGSTIVSGEEHQLAYPDLSCDPTIRMTAGPYYVANSQLRSDVREDRVGVPLRLELRVLHEGWCNPVSGMIVEMWQCDANGEYSAVENMIFDYKTLKQIGLSTTSAESSFLRGHQISDQNGAVVFDTIFPGWYMPRLTHIHIKVFAPDQPGTDTQIFFSESIEKLVYESDPYVSRGPNLITKDRDLVIKGRTEIFEHQTIDLVRKGDGYVGKFDVTTFARPKMT
jgi:protocatechuate 3,4-dioxygenase beta subunit